VIQNGEYEYILKNKENVLNKDKLTEENFKIFENSVETLKAKVEGFKQNFEGYKCGNDFVKIVERVLKEYDSKTADKIFKTIGKLGLCSGTGPSYTAVCVAPVDPPPKGWYKSGIWSLTDCSYPVSSPI